MALARRIQTFNNGDRLTPRWLNQWQDYYGNQFTKPMVIARKTGVFPSSPGAPFATGTYAMGNSLTSGQTILFKVNATTCLAQKAMFYVNPTIYTAGSRTNNFYLYTSINVGLNSIGIEPNIFLAQPTLNTASTTLEPWISASGSSVLSYTPPVLNSNTSYINISGPVTLSSGHYAMYTTLNNTSSPAQNFTVESKLCLKRQ